LDHSSIAAFIVGKQEHRMKTRKFIFIFLIPILMVALASALTPQPVHAQCGIPGSPPCPPKKKRPTATSVPPTATFTPTATATSTPTPIPAGLPLTGGEPGQGSSGFGLPGPFGMLILVMIIGVLFAGGLFIWFRSRFGGGGSPQADDLNPQPLPPKGITDGTDQFQKADDVWINRNQIGGSGGDSASHLFKKTTEKVGEQLDTEMNKLDTEMNRMDTEMRDAANQLKKLSPESHEGAEPHLDEGSASGFQEVD
jgi:hypothetical protein